jgi:hypothetical protein
MIKCFANSQDNKDRRKREEALSQALRHSQCQIKAIQAAPGLENNSRNLVPRSLLEKRSIPRPGRSRTSYVSRNPREIGESSSRRKSNPRFLAPDVSSTTSTSSSIQEQFYSNNGDSILKKSINNYKTARPCTQCHFRNWSRGDTCYLMMKQKSSEEENEYRQLLWLCPDCALKNGMPEKHYQFNINRLPPVPDEVVDVTMNKPIKNEKDTNWLTHRQHRRYRNWESQYSAYYDDIVLEQQQQQKMCSAIEDDPENIASYIQAAAACSNQMGEHVEQRRSNLQLSSPAQLLAAATSCGAFISSYEYDNEAVGNACHMYLGDL